MARRDRYIFLGKTSFFRIVQVWLIIIGAAILIRTSAWWRMSGELVEALLLLAIFTALFSTEPVRLFLSRLPRPHRLLLTSFLALLLIGQLAGRSRFTFPFVTWSMYSLADNRGIVQFYEIKLLDHEGDSVEVNPIEIFSSASSFSLLSKIRATVNQAVFEKDEMRQKDGGKRLDDLLRAVAAAYQKQHSDQRLDSAEVIFAYFNFREGNASDMVREPVWKTDLMDLHA